MLIFNDVQRGVKFGKCRVQISQPLILEITICQTFDEKMSTYITV